MGATDNLCDWFFRSFFHVINASGHSDRTVHPKMAAFTRLPSGAWRVQVRHKGRYVSETFLRREDVRRWAVDSERQVDRGETPSLRA